MYPYQSHVRLGAVTLNVRNLALETQYYQEVLGLSLLNQTQTSASLGIANTQTTLVTLRQVQADPTPSYGLYHLAILLPSRADLGNFLNHLIRNQIPIVGGADHGYSEAIYLEDAEGNGVEVYHDQAERLWDRQGDKIIGITESMDVEGVLASATSDGKDYKMPDHTKMGHIHLSVQNVTKASNFYQTLFAMTEKFGVPNASWISSGQYHHHFAFNSWAGQNLTNPTPETPGLLEFKVYVTSIAYFNAVKQKALALGQLRDQTPEQFIIEDLTNNRILVTLENV